MSKTTKRITADDVSSSTPRALSDIQKTIDHLADELKALEQMFGEQKKVMASVSVFTIDQTQTTTSPLAKPATKLELPAEDLEKISKNYDIIRSMNEVLRTLSATVAKIQVSFPSDNPAAQKMLRETMALQENCKKQINDAASFISDLAHRQAPKAFTKFLADVDTVLARTISYAQGRSFMYVFTAGGQLAFANYFYLERAVDENGSHFPELFVVLSMRVDKTPTFYINTMVEMEPPSEMLFARQVTDIKSVVRSLHLLLAMDSFHNTIGSKPLRFILDREKITLQNFNAAEHIDRMMLDDDLGTITFRLKKNVPDSDIPMINAQLYQDVKAILEATRAKLRTQIRDNGTAKELTFYLEREPGETITEEDVKGLRTRFQLNDKATEQIVRIINRENSASVDTHVDNAKLSAFIGQAGMAGVNTTGQWQAVGPLYRCQVTVARDSIEHRKMQNDAGWRDYTGAVAKGRVALARKHSSGITMVLRNKYGDPTGPLHGEMFIPAKAVNAFGVRSSKVNASASFTDTIRPLVSGERSAPNGGIIVPPMAGKTPAATMVEMVHLATNAGFKMSYTGTGTSEGVSNDGRRLRLSLDGGEVLVFESGVQSGEQVTASTEQARVKGTDEYAWRKYMGPEIGIPFRSKEVPLYRGDIIGLRWSSNKRDKRMVIQRLGLTFVFTLNAELEKKLEPFTRKLPQAQTAASKQTANVYENVATYISAMKKASRTSGWSLDTKNLKAIRWTCSPTEANSSALMSGQYVLTFFTQQFGRPQERNVGDLRSFIWLLKDEVPVVVTMTAPRGGSMFEVQFDIKSV